jgi:hypothetical protein
MTAYITQQANLARLDDLRRQADARRTATPARRFRRRRS